MCSLHFRFGPCTLHSRAYGTRISSSNLLILIPIHCTFIYFAVQYIGIKRLSATSPRNRRVSVSLQQTQANVLVY
jgi:hypothetical protein